MGDFASCRNKLIIMSQVSKQTIARVSSLLLSVAIVIFIKFFLLFPPSLSLSLYQRGPCFTRYKTFRYMSLRLSFQWGAKDAEIKDPSVENPELKGSPFKTWSMSEFSPACSPTARNFFLSKVLPKVYLPGTFACIFFSKTSPEIFKSESKTCVKWVRDIVEVLMLLSCLLQVNLCSVSGFFVVVVVVVFKGEM